MITINYEATVPSGTASYRVYITATGETPAEVCADAERQRIALGAVNLQADGLHNRRSYWEKMYGTDYSSDCRFADTPNFETPKQSWWKRLFFPRRERVRLKMFIQDFR